MTWVFGQCFGPVNRGVITLQIWIFGVRSGIALGQMLKDMGQMTENH
jgi:hypothetical protein